jgi:integrase
MLSKPTDKHLITEADARDLPAPDRGSWIFYDAHAKKRVAGFGVRITSAGARAFILNYRAAGVERRLTIGAHPTWTVDGARARARELSQAIDTGRDPLAEKIAAREAPTMRQLARRAVADHFAKKRPSTRYDVYGDRVDEAGDPTGGQMAKWIIPALGNLKVAAVRAADIEALHAKMTKAGSPIRANRCVATLSKMMSLAMRWGWRPGDPHNPAKVDRNPEVAREVYLEPDQIVRLIEALGGLPSRQAARIIWLALLTGARRGEILKATWEQFDFAKNVWHKPATNTKQKRVHRVPLLPPVVELLREIRKQSAGGPYLFPGRSGEGHMVEIKKSWDTVRKKAGLQGVRLHDLRHTFASYVANDPDANLLIIGKLLGHSSPVTTNRYVHLFLDPQRAAAGKAVAEIIGGRIADVVPLREDG